MTNSLAEKTAADLAAPTLATVRAAFAWARTPADFDRAAAGEQLAPQDQLAVLDAMRAADRRLRPDWYALAENAGALAVVDRELAQLGWSKTRRRKMRRALEAYIVQHAQAGQSA